MPRTSFAYVQRAASDLALPLTRLSNPATDLALASLPDRRSVLVLDFLRRNAPELLPVGAALAGAGAQSEFFAARHHDRRAEMPRRRPDRRGSALRRACMIAGRATFRRSTSPTTTPRPASPGTAAIAVQFARLYIVELQALREARGVPMTIRREGQPAGPDRQCAATSARRCRGFVALPLLVGYDIDDPMPQRGGTHRLLRRRRWLAHRGGGLSGRRVGSLFASPR